MNENEHNDEVREQRKGKKYGKNKENKNEKSFIENYTETYKKITVIQLNREWNK